MAAVTGLSVFGVVCVLVLFIGLEWACRIFDNPRTGFLAHTVELLILISLALIYLRLA